MASLSFLLPQKPIRLSCWCPFIIIEADAAFKKMLYRLHFDFISDLWKVFSFNITGEAVKYSLPSYLPRPHLIIPYAVTGFLAGSKYL